MGASGKSSLLCRRLMGLAAACAAARLAGVGPAEGEKLLQHAVEIRYEESVVDNII